MNALDAIKALRTRLSTDVALNDFFADQYGSEATLKHFIGYKRTQSAIDCPNICYVPSRNNPLSNNSDLQLSVIVGINDARFFDENDDEIFNENIAAAQFVTFAGLRNSLAAADLIIAALYPLQLSPGCIVRLPPRVTTDLGLGHPFYQAEVALTINFRT